MFQNFLTVEARPVTLDRDVITLHRASFSLNGRQIWAPSHSIQEMSCVAHAGQYVGGK